MKASDGKLWGLGWRRRPVKLVKAGGAKARGQAVGLSREQGSNAVGKTNEI